LLIAAVAMADRVDVWMSASVNLQTVTIGQRSDGGCVVTACASYRKTDGGVLSNCATSGALNAGDQNHCLKTLEAAGIVFKAQEQL
jgi:hypothetical protein